MEEPGEEVWDWRYYILYCERDYYFHVDLFSWKKFLDGNFKLFFDDI